MPIFRMDFPIEQCLWYKNIFYHFQWAAPLIGMFFAENTPETVLDLGLERGSAKGTMADLRPLGS